jgi:hypothetical protein
MTRQMFWRSEAVHEGKLTPPALGRKWWSMIGALGAVGLTGYLLLGFADGRHGGREPSLDVADTPLAPNKTNASSHSLLGSSFLLVEKWQNLPLLALQNSPEIEADGEIRLLALQAAFERERNSAANAQLQLATLQDEVAHLRERQEEVLVLREQLADAEAHKTQARDSTSEETEQKERADHALLRVVALQEELASLGREVFRAKTAAEGEKARAASALMQLEAAQYQLATVTALQSDRAEIESHPQSDATKIVDSASLNSPGDPLPAERASKLPLSPGPNTAVSVEQRQIPSRSVRLHKSEKGAATNSRQALLSIESRLPSRPVNKIAPVPVRRPEPDASRLKRSRQALRNQSVRSVGTPPQGAGSQSRLLAHDIQELPNPGILILPGALLPDSTLW